jgi:uncharacterized delta-60 repeat protein
MKFLPSKFLPVLFVCISAVACAQSVLPDLNYASQGKALFNYAFDAPTFNNCVAQQADGKIVIGGNVIARLLPNGQPDISFNNSGVYFDPDMNIAPRSIDVKNGNILALYADYNTDSALVLKKINSDGQPDRNFGNNGKLIFSLPGIKLTGNKLLLQADEKIIVTGSADTAVFIIRLLPNGLPDTVFNHTGYTLMPIDGGSATAIALALQGANIVVTGSFTDKLSFVSRLFCTRFLSNGQPDAGFANSGLFFTDGASGFGIMPEAIAVQTDNKILIAATTGAAIMVLRLKPGGLADSSFNTTGSLLTAVGQSNKAVAIIPGPAGKIIVAAETLITPADPSNWNYAVIQLLENGGTDFSFNGSGKMYQSVAGVDHCAGAILQAGGRLLLTGFANEYSLITLVAVDALGQPDYDFGNGGIKILQLLGTPESLVAALEQEEKKIVLAGNRTEGVLDKSNIVLTRLTADGKSIDNNFGNNGKAGYVQSNTMLTAAALQQDGRIVLCGIYFDEAVSRYRTIVSRLTADGFTDFNFAPLNNFRVLTEPVQNNAAPQPLAIQSDDYIVTGQNLTNGRIAINRFTVDGDADVFFGNNGKKEIFEPGKSYTFSNVVMQPDNKIVVAAHERINDTTTAITLFRLLPWGPADNSFSGSGTITLPFNTYDDGSLHNICLAVDDESRVITGATQTAFNTNTGKYETAILVSRLNTDGTADVSFNNSGTLLIPVDSSISYINLSQIKLHPDSSIFIAGNRGRTEDGQRPFLMRITKEGKVDSTVSAAGNGTLLIERNRGASVKSLLITADSSVMAACTAFNNSSNNDLMLTAYRTRELNVYRFTGDGNWTDTSNWHNNAMPPPILPTGGFIFIQPKAGGKCVLNTNQQLQQGSCLVVVAGKNLIVNGNLIID